MWEQQSKPVISLPLRPLDSTNERVSTSSSSSRSDSGSYSYSYSETESATETETASTVTREPPLTGQKKFLSFPDLPLPVPQPPRPITSSQVNQPISAEAKKERPSNTNSASSDSYGDSEGYSYSYSHSSNSNEEEDTGSSSGSSYSYSYSSESTKRGKYDATQDKRLKTTHDVKPEESSLSYTYSESLSTEKGRGGGSVTHTYSSTTSGSRSRNGSDSVGTEGSDSYGYSYSSSTDGSTTTRASMPRVKKVSGKIAESTKGTEESSTRDIKKDVATKGSQSYSSSHLCTEDEKTRSSSKHHVSLSSTESETSGVKAAGGSTRIGSRLSESLEIKPNKVSPLSLSTSKSETTPSNSSTNSLITGSIGSGSLRDSSVITQHGTTSTYTEDREGLSQGSVLTDVTPPTASMQTRQVIVLTVPPEEAPRFRVLPRICLVPRGSENDTLSFFLNQLMWIQSDFIRREAEKETMESVSTAIKGDGTKSTEARSKLKTKKGMVKEKQQALGNVPQHHFIKKSLKFALKAVGVETAEERAVALREFVMPMHRDAALSILETYAQKSVFKRVKSMFLAHDKFQSGEVPLDVTLELLGRCGIAHRNMENLTLSICTSFSKGRTPLLCVIQRMPPSGPPIATVEGEEPKPLETKMNEEVVDVCNSALRTGGAAVYWDERRGCIYVGNQSVMKAITSSDTAKRIVVQLEALIYVCFALEACTIEDKSLSAVLYTPLLAALLSCTSKDVPDTKSVLIENALVSVLNPLKQLERLSAHRNLQEKYLMSGEEPILSDTLPERLQDFRGTMVERLRRQVNWAPNPTSDGGGFEMTPPMDPDDVYCELGIKKLRLKELTPEGACCYCLVSARATSGGNWMPTVRIPVVSIKASKKNGFKWKFSRDHSQRVLFACKATDTICIEACYDVEESAGETVTWCVGHVLVSCRGAKSGKLSISPGSLFSDFVTPVPVTKLVQPSKGLFCSLKRKKNATPAISMSILVTCVHSNSLPARASVPPRFLAFRRHVPLMAQLRDAIMNVGGSQMTPLHVLRQQQVQHALVVMLNPTLMDQLQELWERTLQGKMGTKPTDIVQKQRALLTLATKVFSVHNNISGNQAVITNIVGRGAAIPVSVNSLAPRRPVFV
ncbi:hypothetical protein TcYC6_0092320 [Trypanosoma cruzi]|uniref:Uncharacterized protein n=1 Tax=Trypanosoma cruzi TaxID=5693 RepID=A0A7J6XYQ9_TRYCR|nr:hypothetical protein ECC02_008029 [Trypanosoma cruzi]KAF8295659.1 hypothetical protein TcYC6_0092320 [Trypanosoma cruzi]